MSDPVCSFHEDRDKDIKQIVETVNQHRGQWKIMLWVVGIFVSFMSGLGVLHYQSQQKLVGHIVSMDKTFTAYIARDTQEALDLKRRVGATEDRVIDHETRLRFLEKE